MTISGQAPDDGRGGAPQPGAYASSLRIEFDDGRVVEGAQAHELLAQHAGRHRGGGDVSGGRCAAVVRVWHDEGGWGVADAAETPGGCWVHFSVVDVQGYRALRAGQEVLLEWEAADQDGYAYRATRVQPLEQAHPGA